MGGEKKQNKNTDCKIGMCLNTLCKKNQLVHLDGHTDVYVCADYTVRQNFPNWSEDHWWSTEHLLIINGKLALHKAVLFPSQFQLLSCTKDNQKYISKYWTFLFHVRNQYELAHGPPPYCNLQQQGDGAEESPRGKRRYTRQLRCDLNSEQVWDTLLWDTCCRLYMSTQDNKYSVIWGRNREPVQNPQFLLRFLHWNMEGMWGYWQWG